MSLLFALAGSDTTAPTLLITVDPDRTKISGQTGKNTSTFTFTANEDYMAYQLRAVPAEDSLVDAGTLVESGSGGLADVPRVVNVTQAELAAAGLSGTNRIKVFGQDLAGNWST